ncbi:MAG: FAD-binding oxidoreductase [Candidatus Hodarchaeota archaeon]
MLSPDVKKGIAEIVGVENCSDDDAILYVYGFDVSDVKGKPDLVVRPSSTGEISKICVICSKNKVPVIPRGGGTGAAGGVVPVTGGIVLDLTRMNKLLEMDLDNLQVHVQAGILIGDLNDTLEKQGFFFPVTPGSAAMATIGGTVANDASGLRAFKYGTAKDYLLEATVILMDGQVVKIGGKPLKNVAGFDLLRLFAGSEGTLGIMSEMRLKVLPLPISKGVLVAYFDDLELIGKAVREVYRTGVIPSAMELLDRSALEAIRAYSPETKVSVKEAMLLLELEGSEPCVDSQGNVVMKALESIGAIGCEFSKDPVKCDDLWEARSLVGAATSVLEEEYNRVYEGEDICVPLTEISRTLLKLRELREKYKLGCVIFGHVSIGSLHPAITLRKSNEKDWTAVKEMADEIHRWAIEVNGTVTGEHGIGIARKKYLKLQNPEAYEIMKKIKNILDPGNLMNPGKIF